jgi:hypothetical protein
MSQPQLVILSKFVLFSIIVLAVGFTLVFIGVALPPVVGENAFKVGSYVVYQPNGRIDPNPLQLPFLVGGAVVLIGGLGFLGFQLFKRQSVKVPVKD